MRRAWLLAVATAALIGVDLTQGASLAQSLASLMLAAMGAIGAFVASRRPENPSGWLLAVIALSFAGAIAGDGLFDATGSVASAWVASWVWVPAVVAIAVFPLVFPTGRPPGPRWRPVLWWNLAAGVLVAVGSAFAPGPFEDYAGVRNPVGVELLGVLGQAGFPALLAGIVASIASLVVRFRGSRGVERQQLKWVTAAAILVPVGFAAPLDDDAGFAVLVLGALVMAFAVAVAVLRYRLYDIDLVVNRALVYGALTATIAGAYFASVLLAQLVLPERSDVAVAASTLAAAALVRPARARIQALVDRRFFRSRYDAGQALSAFGARLRNEVSLEAVSAEFQGTAADLLQPAHISLWLR